MTFVDLREQVGVDHFEDLTSERLELSVTTAKYLFKLLTHLRMGVQGRHELHDTHCRHVKSMNDGSWDYDRFVCDGRQCRRKRAVKEVAPSWQ